MRIRRLSQKTLLKYILYLLKWVFTIGCICFVLWGWYSSVLKFMSGQTSVSITMNESETFVYPSMTFCTKFRGDIDIITAILDEAKLKRVNSTDYLDINGIISNISYKREDYLALFSHPEYGNPWDGLFVLYEDSYWKASVPHPEESGVCYTYDPQFESNPSMWNGIRFGFKFPGTENSTQQEKEALIQMVTIFLHKKDNFMFYKQDDRPNSGKLDVSLYHYHRENSITLKYHSFTRLPTKKMPCSNDASYDFNKCVEKAFAKIRGCQYPWHYFEEFGIPVCKNISNLEQSLWSNYEILRSKQEADWSRPFESTSRLSKKTNCPVTCRSVTYSTDIGYADINSWMTEKDNGAEWIVYLWFKNFLFEYEEEFVVCDWSCLLGELGGNLGFFLGGSLLAYLNFFLDPLFARINN